jgi:hypothetical protein
VKRSPVIPKGFGERIQKALGGFDSECGLVGLNTEILEKQVPKEIALERRLVNGGLEELFTSIENKSFDIGFMVGYTVAQMPEVSNEKFKPIVEDMKKLIISRQALPKQQGT